MKSVFKAVATVTIFTIITRLLGFFFRIFLSRKIGAEGLGLYQMAISIMSVFVTLIASGIPLTTAKLVSKYTTNNELKKRNKAVTTALVIALSLAMLSSILIIVLKCVWKIVLLDNRAVELLIILIPSLIFSAIYAVFRGALWGQNDYFNCGLTELLEQIIRFVITAIMLNNIVDMFLATKYTAISFNITCLCSALITIFIYLKRAKLDFSTGEYKNVFKSSMPVTGVRLANSLVQPLTTLIIPTMLIVAGYSTIEATSSVGVVMGMTFPMLYVPMSIIGSLSMVLIPTITSMLTKNNFVAINENVTKSVQVSVFVSMLFIPLYLAVGNLIGLVLYDNAMAGVLLQVSALAVLPISLTNLSGSILNALNLEVKSFVNYLIGSGVLFICLIVLTPLIDINAVCISYIISMTLIASLNFRMIKKTLKSINLNLLSICLKYILIIIPCVILGTFVANIFKHFNILVACIMGGGVSIIFTILLCQVFNLYSVKQLLQLVRK